VQRVVHGGAFYLCFFELLVKPLGPFRHWSRTELCVDLQEVLQELGSCPVHAYALHK
jgi:hypothetical protein